MGIMYLTAPSVGRAGGILPFPAHSRTQQDGMPIPPRCLPQHQTLDATSLKALNAKPLKRSYVNVRYRLRGKRKVYRYLNQLAGANRYLWNAALSQCQKNYKETGKANTSFFGLTKWYKNHKHSETPWLKEYLKVLTRPGLKDLSNAYKEFFRGGRRFPKFKKRKGKENVCG